MTIEWPDIDVSGDPQLAKAMINVLRRAFEIWQERHAKYGRLNIALWGAAGCALRATDKVMRLRRYYLGQAFSDETLQDTWLDLLNYAAMGLLCQEGQWSL